MGYVRLWRHKQLVPGIRLNVSKSGPSLSFGPRGLHYTVGRRGRRMTAGIPGTGVFYTSYSRNHARQAARVQVSPTRFAGTPSTTVAVSHKEPMLPRNKIILGICLIWLPPVGLIILLVGLAQRHKPLWVARTLVADARRKPEQAAALLQQAATVLPNSPEVLAPLAEYQFSQSDWTQAAQTFDQYLQMAPTDWVALAHCGMAYLNAGNYDAAISHFVKLRETAPLAPDSHASASAHLAMAFLHKGDAGQAEAIAKAENLRQRVLGGGGQQCLFVRALAQYQAGQHSAAIADLDRLYAMNPMFGDVTRTKAAMQAGTYTLG
jgi:tetratricopeptide (TPR) repeat protein